jgi:hypothetical protein
MIILGDCRVPDRVLIPAAQLVRRLADANKPDGYFDQMAGRVPYIGHVERWNESEGVGPIGFGVPGYGLLWCGLRAPPASSPQWRLLAESGHRSLHRPS